jgi:hypothetical protein
MTALFGEGGVFPDFEIEENDHAAELRIISSIPACASDEGLHFDFDLGADFDLHNVPSADLTKSLEFSGADSGYSSPTDSPTHQWWTEISELDLHEQTTGERNRLLSLSGFPLDFESHDQPHDLLTITADCAFGLGTPLKQEEHSYTKDEAIASDLLADSALGSSNQSNRGIDPTVLTQLDEEDIEIEIDVVGDGDESQYSSPALLSRADSVASVTTIASTSTAFATPCMLFII